MGCQACRQSEPETTFHLEQDIKSLDPLNQMNSGKKEDYNSFLITFENKLPIFGNYFGSDFNTLIPLSIQNYMTENPFSLPQDLLGNSEYYEMKPVEFTNGNVYKGGWSSEMKMEGQGKYYLKEEGVLAEGIWKEGNLIFARVFITKENELGELEDMFGIIFPKRALETVFDNIISNAVSHGFVDKDRKDYKILFSELFDDFDRFVIKISNNGVPLPEYIKTEDVFVYGYSTSLNAETPDGKEHHGLGGYDTRNILKKYGADVQIISSPDEEYTVTYVLTFTKTDLIYE